MLCALLQTRVRLAALLLLLVVVVSLWRAAGSVSTVAAVSAAATTATAIAAIVLLRESATEVACDAVTPPRAEVTVQALAQGLQLSHQSLRLRRFNGSQELE